MQLYNGDCLEVMKSIPDKSIDLILCDLPYGITKCKWDTPIDLFAMWNQYNRIIKDNAPILLFAQTPFDKVLGSSNLSMLKYEWIWEKTQATGHLNAKKMPIYNPQKTTGHKPIHSYTKYIKTQNNTELYGYMKQEISGGGETDRYPRSIITFASDKQTCHLHPTQKPVTLLEYFIKTYTNEEMLVLDNCMGSGSTGIACINTNRNFIGIELDKQYFDIAKERLTSYKKCND